MKLKLFPTPLWVKNYPNESDRKALTALADSSWGPLSRPREMTYVLTDFQDPQAAENAAFSIRGQGWNCQVIGQADGGWSLQCGRKNYRLTEQQYLSDTAYFNRMARYYRANFDGWQAAATAPHYRLQTGVNGRSRAILTIWLIIVLASIGSRIFEGVTNLLKPAGQSTQSQNQATTTQPSALPTANSGSQSTKVADAYDPNAPMVHYNSDEVGISFEHSSQWRVDEVKVPCVGDEVPSSGLQEECYLEIRWASFTQRYAPTMRISRYANSLNDVERFNDMEYSRSSLNQVTKEHTFFRGKPALTYVVYNKSTDSKHQALYVESNLKVYSFSADTPRGSVPDLDYFAAYTAMSATFQVNK